MLLWAKDDIAAPSPGHGVTMICPVCDVTLESRFALSEHVKQHALYRICRTCGQFLPGGQAALATHITAHKAEELTSVKVLETCEDPKMAVTQAVKSVAQEQQKMLQCGEQMQERDQQMQRREQEM